MPANLICKLNSVLHQFRGSFPKQLTQVLLLAIRFLFIFTHSPPHFGLVVLTIAIPLPSLVLLILRRPFRIECQNIRQCCSERALHPELKLLFDNSVRRHKLADSFKESDIYWLDRQVQDVRRPLL